MKYIIKDENGEFLWHLRMDSVPGIDDEAKIFAVPTDKRKLAKKFKFEYAVMICQGLALCAFSEDKSSKYYVVPYDEQDMPKVTSDCQVFDFKTGDILK